MESPGPVPSPSMSPLPARPPLGVRSSCGPPASSKIAIPSVGPAVPGPEIDDTGDGGAGQVASAQGTAKVRADWADIESEAKGGSWPPKSQESTLGPASAPGYGSEKADGLPVNPSSGVARLKATSYVIHAWDTRLPTLEVFMAGGGAAQGHGRSC